MKVIRPTFVTDTNLTSHSVPENDHPTWVSGTAYMLGQKVIRGHKRWESAANSNAGNDPLTATGAEKWNDLGATNRWAMFDRAVGSVTQAVDAITVVLTPGRIDSLAVLDVTGKKVTVVMTRGTTEVYRREQVTAVGGRAIASWYDWFFEPIGKRRRLVFDDLPSYRDGVLTVTIDGDSDISPVGCGTLLIGRQFEIGSTASDASIGIDNFSKKERDQFGVITFVERAYSDRNSYKVAFPSSRTDAIRDVMTSLRATPTIWIGDDGLDALFTYGIASIAITLTTLSGTSFASVEVEGLV